MNLEFRIERIDVMDAVFKVIAININDRAERDRFVATLANSGIKVWVEKRQKEVPRVIENHVCFEIRVD